MSERSSVAVGPETAETLCSLVSCVVPIRRCRGFRWEYQWAAAHRFCRDTPRVSVTLILEVPKLVEPGEWMQNVAPSPQEALTAVEVYAQCGLRVKGTWVWTSIKYRFYVENKPYTENIKARDKLNEKMIVTEI